MTLAFTGASGHLGHLVAQSLLARTSAADLVALARTTSRAHDLADQGIEVRHVDYDAPQTLAPALEGVDRLLFISGTAVGHRLGQHRAVIDAAAQAGVTFLAYTSVLHVDTARTLAVAPDHLATERLLADSPLTVALLRNGWYSENYIDPARAAAESGTLVTSAGQGRVFSASRADYAEAAAAVLSEQTPQAATYELAGDTGFTAEEFAATVSELSGRPVSVQQLSSEDHLRLLLKSGVPGATAEFLVSTDRAIIDGELADDHPGTLSRLIGRPTTPLRDTLAPAFS